MSPRTLLAGLAVLAAVTPAAAQAAAPQRLDLGRLTSRARAEAVRGPDGWGIRVRGAGQASVTEPRPVAVEATASTESPIRRLTQGYDRVRRTRDGFVGTARVRLCSCAAFAITDTWRLKENSLLVTRRTQVRGSARGGFATGVRLVSATKATRQQVKHYLPAQIYGTTEGIIPLAIGGSATYGADGIGVARVREDRLPAPLYGLQHRDGTSLTVLDPSPDGRSTAADTQDKVPQTIIDAGIRVQALEVEHRAGRVRSAMWMPASEGETTYVGGGFERPLAAEYRRRFHPIRRGFVQRLDAEFRFAPAQDERSFRRDAWRHSYDTLKPRVPLQPQAVAREALAAMLTDRIATTNGRTGISLIWNAVTGEPNAKPGTGPVLLGFVGRNLETAHLLLRDSLAHPGPEAERRIRLAGQMADSMTLMPMNPPVGEGFDFVTGAPVFYPKEGVVHLRSLSDDAEALLQAVVLARAKGVDPSAGTVEDPERAAERAAGGRPARGPEGWLTWLREIGDFLVAAQLPDGTIPRNWKAGTREPIDTSAVSSMIPVPFLARLSEATGDPRYAATAERAGERQWQEVVRNGFFSGGIIDTVGVNARGEKEAAIDSEGPGLALQAYLALLKSTGDPKWLERAKAAAEAEESWLVLWRIPSATSVPEKDLHFKPSASPIGMNMTSSGQSFLDQHTGFVADEFLELARLTGDDHWREVTKLVLHGGKAMLALPGREYDLAGPGWQQEGTYMATPRGRGLNRSWLPWIANSQLHSTLMVEATDPAAFAKLSGP